MKKATFLSFLLICAAATFAQSAKYTELMKKHIGALDSAVYTNKGLELANTFTRIGDAEKNQWLPYYYAAYATAMHGLMQQDVNEKDKLAEQANTLLQKSETILGKENSEIATIKSMIATLQMTVDPQTRYMTYGALITENINKAESLDSTNPRPVLLQAQNLYYTPEAFGGGAEAARPLFEKAKARFESFKPENELSPNWGKSSLDYFLGQYK